MNTQTIDSGSTSETGDQAHSLDDRDALYKASLEHFQNGRWQEAIDGFEAVLQLDPEHAEARTFLEEARLKASLDQAKPKPRRFAMSGRVRRLIWVALGSIALVAVLVTARWAYGRFVTPQREQQQATLRLAQQLAQANNYLAERDYAAAEQAFRQLLTQDPTNTAAQQGLAEAQKKIVLSTSYTQAMQAVSGEDWDEAARILSAIITQDAGFKDAKAQLTNVQNRQQLNSSFDNAEKAYQDGDWKQAISAYEMLRNLDAEFKRDTVTEHLFDSYVKEGISLVANVQGGAEAVRQAQDLYKKALTLKPQQPQAMLELDLSEKYLEGQTRLAQGDMAGAIAALEAVLKQNPDYASGNAAALLKATGSQTATVTTPIGATAATTGTAGSSAASAPVPAEGTFQQKYASSMLKGDEALTAGDYVLAEQNYREAVTVAVHGGYNSARWLFAAYAKAGTAAARRGDNESGIEQIRTAITLMAKSAVAIPSEAYSSFVSQGDSAAQKKDYVNAFAQYSKALQVISQKCNCGLEDWSILS